MGSLQVYILHPDEIPIELHPMPSLLTPEISHQQLKLLCHSASELSIGSSVGISIPQIESDFEVQGQIAACQPGEEGYQVTVAFQQPDNVMRIRMLEQLCYIHRYRKAVLLQEGRDLSEQEAALEWVAKYAALFPVDNV
ncbi:hypothetical protein ACFVYJ_03365 [Pontibacter sp. JAM-7]|uniref:hypothetical protein n=1 Tax=Pontibacter sp. JAM-7 TaxID=3366581 RepID=UPI003AF9DE28